MEASRQGGPLLGARERSEPLRGGSGWLVPLERATLAPIMRHWMWRWHRGIAASLQPGRGILRSFRPGGRNSFDSRQRRTGPGSTRSHRPRYGRGRGVQERRRLCTKTGKLRRGAHISYQAILPHPEALTSLYKAGPLLLQVDRKKVISGTASLAFLFFISASRFLTSASVGLTLFTSWATRLFL